MPHRYFMFFSYHGAAYHGWQLQPNAISVQAVVEDGLSKILGKKIEVTGAGRTDTGVHARYYAAHFETDAIIAEPEKLAAKLNSFFPSDISVYNIVAVKPDAHARFSAVERSYEYWISPYKNPFNQGLAWHYYKNLNVEFMNVAADVLMEYNDFTSFSKLHTDCKTNNCKISYARWSKAGDLLVFSISADRFLRNMVRAIVGTLVDVGLGKINLDEFRKIIESKNRCNAGTSVPAHGLYLVDVKYPESIYL